jgi:hypothetical protein
MKAQYIRAMDTLHRGCEILAGACLVIITLIIPGVFWAGRPQQCRVLARADGGALMIALSPLGGGSLSRASAYWRR